MLPLSFIDRLIAAQDEHAKRTACFNREERLDYESFYQSVFRIVDVLKSETSDRIGVVMDHYLVSYAAIVAVWLSGKTYVPIDPRETDELREEKIKECGVGLVLMEEGYSNLALSVPTVDISALPPKPASQLPPYRPSSIAYILSTSGTTGRPKYIPISYNNLSCFVDSFLTICPDLNETNKFIQWSPLKYDMSIISYLIPLCIGASFWSVIGPGLPHIQGYRDICAQALDVVITTPSAMVMNKPFMLEMTYDHVNFAFFGAETLELEVVEFWKQAAPKSRNFNLYGPSEAGIFATYHPIPRSERHLKIPIGTEAKHIQSRIEPIGNDLEYGELWLSGEQVFDGYLNQELNAACFCKINDVIWYKTGDIVRRNEAGLLHFAGRTDAQFKVAGKRVNPEALGAFLTKNGFTFRHRYFESKNIDGLSMLTLVIEGDETAKKAFDRLSANIPLDFKPNQVEYVQDISRIEIKDHRMHELPSE